jgi:hypothetical protein
MPNILKDSLCGEGFSGREANRRATDRNKHGPFFFFFFLLTFCNLARSLIWMASRLLHCLLLSLRFLKNKSSKISP